MLRTYAVLLHLLRDQVRLRDLDLLFEGVAGDVDYLEVGGGKGGRNRGTEGRGGYTSNATKLNNKKQTCYEFTQNFTQTTRYPSY